MFSPLAKGNGSWDGHLEDESTFDNLFPSIYQTSTHKDGMLPQTETNTPQDPAIHLPKTFLTRKGAILLFAQNGKQNVFDRRKLTKNDEKIKGDNIVNVEEQMPQDEKRKLFLEFLDVFLKDQTTNTKPISQPINFKENTWISNQQHEEKQTENVFKVLSRPKSINSFYNHKTHVKKTRPKTAVPGNVLLNEPEQSKAHPRISSGKPRPPTRALGKLPYKNTRSEFDKEKTPNFLQPTSIENHQTFLTRQLTTPNYSTTNEMVQDERISIPRPNSECRFDQSEKASRAASSMSKYSTWWAMDDVSLSYYDNELQDDDDPECIECLSEQRSEIGCKPMSDLMSDIQEDTGSITGSTKQRQGISTLDIPQSKDSHLTFHVSNAFSVEENEKECFSPNWPSKCDSQQHTDFNKELNAFSTGYETHHVATETFKDVWFKDSCAERSSKSRVKSAPCLEKRNEPRFRRSVLSAGPNRLHMPSYSVYGTVTPTALENSSIRIPSAASCYDNENDKDSISVSEDEYRTDPEELEENSDIESTNQRVSAMTLTSSPGLSLLSHGDEGSGYEVETKDDSDISIEAALENTKLTKQEITKPAEQDLKTDTQDRKTAQKNIKSAKQEIKPAKQDMKPAKLDTLTAKQDIKLVKQDVKLTKQDIKPAKQDIKPAKQEMIPAQQDMIPAQQDTENDSLDSDGIELQIFDVLPATLQTFQTLNNEIHQKHILNENESTTSNFIRSQDTELVNDGQVEINNAVLSVTLASEENLSNRHDNDFDSTATETEFEGKLSSGDNDSIAGLLIEDHDIETRDIEELSEENNQKDVTESREVDGEEIPVTNSDTVDLTETSKSLHSDVVQKLSETTRDTNDSVIYERQIQLLSQGNLKTNEQSEENHDSGKVQSISGDRNFETKKIPENAQVSTIGQSSKLISESHDTSRPIKGQETETVKSQSNIRKDSVLNERISNSKINDTLGEKSKLGEKFTTKKEGNEAKLKTEKPKGDKLDIQGVGKTDNKMIDAKDKMEIHAQNKVDLSDLVAKKSSNKTVKKTALRKKAKSPKTVRKSSPTPDQTPEPESSLDVIPTIDENLLKMIENPDGSLELSEETLNQFAPVEDFQDPDMLIVLEDKSIKSSDAFSPSKVKRSSKKAGRSGKKKGRVIATETQTTAGDERKIKMAQEKAKQDEEMKLLKEREDEQRRLLEEAQEKQKIIEEEREKRMAQEAEARRQEEEAEQALKEAKRKAKEEREKRREEEAERRRMEVQKKREEKRKRELEIQKREQELEKQRVDREQRAAELQAQKERELELERIAEEQRKDEERRRLLELEEERRQEEARVREAEEAVQRMSREREYREQMRRIAEAQQAKLEKQEIERRAKEEAERAAIEEERKRLEHEAQMREEEERKRIHELRQQEAIARIRAAHEASKRRAWALRRRAQNTERLADLRFTRQTQKLTEAFTFSYHVHVPREIWELPYDWNSKKKRGSFRPKRKKQNEKKS